jgi:hypothetical protein
MPHKSKYKSILFINWLILITLLFPACNKEKEIEQTHDSQSELIFKSGFEEGVYIDETPYPNNEDYRFIKGTDNETGFSWPISILGAQDSALHYIDDDNHQAVFATLETVTGHDGTSTTALYQQQNYSIGVTQCPYEILDISEGTKDIYIRFWIKLDSASLYKPNMWRTYFEWKTKAYAEENGFRLISFIYTDEEAVPYWHFQGDKSPNQPIWEIDNREIPVPVNEWFLNEFYWHWSQGEDGLAQWKVNGQLIGEHHGPTTRNAQPLDFIMLGQIYGDSNPKHQWLDDIEIWEGPK